jgi:hypothetical protein
MVTLVVSSAMLSKLNFANKRKVVFIPKVIGGVALSILLCFSFFALIISSAQSAQTSPYLIGNASNLSGQVLGPATTVHVFATGLNNPRGLTFGPDGNLYVAEGGTGGNQSSGTACTQVVAPIGPYTGAFTGRISKINSKGMRTTVADRLPSDQTTLTSGGLVSGVADVQFLDGVLYGLESGGGCSHGLPHTDNTIFRVNPDGTHTLVADLSAFLQANPVVIPDAGDFEPDGTWYGFVAVDNSFYATEPNSQQVDHVTLGGQVSRVIDLSTTFVPPGGWQGATSIVSHNGLLYFGSLGTFPVTPGTQSVHALMNGGWIKTVASGLTAILGVAFDSKGRLYVLETDTVAGFPGPSAIGTGTVVRVGDDGKLTTIATGLTFPTGMTFGPDGNLYVSNIGFGAPPGAGQIVKIDIGN